MSRIIAIIILACVLCSATAPAQSYSMPLSALKEKVQELERGYDELEATVALRIDGAVDPESVMSVYAKTAGEPLNVHIMATPALTNGSTVQIVCTADGDGDVLTFNQFKASIKRFR